MAVVIKDVSDETWRKFKSEAAKLGMKHSEFLSKLIDEHKSKVEEKDRVWGILRERKKRLSDEAAKEILELSKKNRKEFKLRY